MSAVCTANIESAKLMSAVCTANIESAKLMSAVCTANIESAKLMSAVCTANIESAKLMSAKEHKLSLFEMACSLPRRIPEDLVREIYTFVDPWRTQYRSVMQELKSKVERFENGGDWIRLYPEYKWLGYEHFEPIWGPLVRWAYSMHPPIDHHLEHIRFRIKDLRRQERDLISRRAYQPAA